MGKYTEINHGISNKINSMISLGMKKADMIAVCKSEYVEKNGSDKGWRNSMASKNEHLRSINSIETMRAAQKCFVDWAKQNGIKKFEKVTREDLCRYLKDRAEKTLPSGKREQRSAWTVSRDLMFCNKVFRQDITKRELSLHSRLQRSVIRGRNGAIPANRPHLAERYKDHIDVARGTGMRRDSVTRVKYKDFNFKGDTPISINLVEKGGKPRTSYILPKFQERIKEIIEPHKGSNEPIFKDYNKSINNHYYRHEYAVDLLAQLKGEHERGESYFQGDFECSFKLTEKEKEMKQWRHIPVEVCGLISANLGHRRIEVLKSYIFYNFRQRVHNYNSANAE